MRCPNCGYERQPVDDDFVPEGECPHCGIVYAKYAQASLKKAELSSSRGDFSDRSHGNKSKAGRTVAFMALVFALCCLVYYFTPFHKGTSDGLQKDTTSLSESNQVELYVVSWCPYCKQAVNFFQSRGIPFTAYDIEKDQDAAGRKNQLDSGRGVPFAVIHGQKLHGYSEESYRRALDHK